MLTALGYRGRCAQAVDMAGFGAAESFAPGPLMPQLDAFADALPEALGPVVLVGNSLGFAVSLRAAQRHPDLVRGRRSARAGRPRPDRLTGLGIPARAGADRSTLDRPRPAISRR
nr:hypothetical protein [Nocardia acidivorans]